jgi:PII-like signaling protein
MKKTSLLAAITASFFMLVSASVWEGAAGIGEGFSENGNYLATNSFPVNTIVEVVNLENNKRAIFTVSSSLENSGLLAVLSKDAADSIGLKDIGRIQMRERDDQVSYSGLGERRSFLGDPNYSTGWNSGELIGNLDEYDWAMIVAEPRPPEDRRIPNPDDIIPSITRPPEIYEPPVIPVIPSISSATASQPVIPPPASVSSTMPPFSAPMIQSFERGSYYVQIGAYRTTQTVESEILKVDKNLPVAVMRIESEDGPIYRVLIGPLNLGDSGAVLQRYKAIYKDALLRVGN